MSQPSSVVEGSGDAAPHDASTPIANDAHGDAAAREAARAAATPMPAKADAVATQQAVPGAIPFRQAPATSAPEVFGVLVTTLVLLAAFYAVVTIAARKGWLQRWMGARAGGGSPQLQVLERLQVSRRTTLLRVRAGEDEFLVAESTGASVQVLPSRRMEHSA